MSGSGSVLRDVFAGVDDLTGLIRLSHHCLKQYKAQFKPDLSLDQARTELYRRIITGGVFATEPPRAIVNADHGTLGWLVIDGGLVLPVREDRTQTQPLVAVDVLYRPQ
jgi:hypothetical protein